MSVEQQGLRIRHEQEINGLVALTGAPAADVKQLFEGELARLSDGATVNSFLVLRATSNVLTILRGRALRPGDIRDPQNGRARLG
jgi:hypothetical protein